MTYILPQAPYGVQCPKCGDWHAPETRHDCTKTKPKDSTTGEPKR
jgi:uncharacterized OB-fold protein